MKNKIFNLHKPSLLLGVLIISFIGNFFTLAKVALISLLFLFTGLKRISKIADFIFLFLFLFLILYVINSYYLDTDTIGTKLAMVLFPSFLYLLGKWYGGSSNKDGHFLLFQIIIGIFLSLISVASVMLSIYQEGFAGLGRNIEIIGAKDTTMNATVLGGNLIILISLAGVLFCPPHQMSLKIWLLVCVSLILALMVVLRIGSRTQLVVAAGSIIAGYIINKKYLNRTLRSIFYAGTILVAIVVERAIIQDSLIATYFSDRIDDASSSVSSAGGRLDRWIGSLDLLLDNPFGWNLNLIGYAHNLWLDAARVGGWGAFFVLALFTVYSLHATFKALNRNMDSRIFVTSTICLTIGFHLLFFVEPILDGFFYPFASYCAFLGSVVGFRSRLTSKSVFLSREPYR